MQTDIEEVRALEVWRAEAERSKLLIATVPGRADWPATQAVIRAMLAFRNEPVASPMQTDPNPSEVGRSSNLRPA